MRKFGGKNWAKISRAELRYATNFSGARLVAVGVHGREVTDGCVNHPIVEKFCYFVVGILEKYLFMIFITYI